jgi:hypothetical protein
MARAINPGAISLSPIRGPRAPAPTTREQQLLEQIEAKITEEDVGECLQVLRESLRATTTIRAPRTQMDVFHRLQNDYVWVADFGTRLAAVRLLLAYKYGNPTGVMDLRLGLPAARSEDPPTHEELVDQLRESGANLREIVDTWVGAAKVAQRVEQPEEVAKTMQVPAHVDVIDVPEE